LRATFFAALLRARFATLRRTAFLAADRVDFARPRRIVMRARDLRAGRFAALRFAAFFDPDLFFAAIVTSNDLEGHLSSED
jgi:hypothetical protein